MMKKLLTAAAAALLFLGCGPVQPEKPKFDVTGSWELISVDTKVSIGDTEVSVYLDFSADGSFALYQKLGEGRYSAFSGTWGLDLEASQLSGTYSDATAWGPYDCACENDVLTLAFPGGSETDSYKKIDGIPASVTGNVY